MLPKELVVLRTVSQPVEVITHRESEPPQRPCNVSQPGAGVETVKIQLVEPGITKRRLADCRLGIKIRRDPRLVSDPDLRHEKEVIVRTPVRERGVARVKAGNIGEELKWSLLLAPSKNDLLAEIEVPRTRRRLIERKRRQQTVLLLRCLEPEPLSLLDPRRGRRLRYVLRQQRLRKQHSRNRTT